MLNRLLKEHDHILKTLNLLEVQFLDLCRGETPDYAIMRSIVVYIQEYPEKVHHPLEDEIFAILLKRVEDDDNKLVHDLVVDHTDLEVLSRNLRKSLETLKDGLVTEEDLKHLLSRFLSRQRQHMYIEERKVYPMIRSVLTDADWDHVKTIVPIFDDPVFGERTQNDYELLYRELTNNE